MVSVFLGIMVATLLMSSAPVYLDALERQGINSAVESALIRDGEVYFSITIRSFFVPLEPDEIERTDAAVAEAISSNVPELHTGTQRHLRTPFYPVLLPPEPRTADGEVPVDEQTTEDAAPAEPPEGLIQSYTGLRDRITLVEGRAPAETVLRGAQGPMVEVLVSSMTAAEFGGLTPGDVLVVAPSHDSPVKVSARIVGIVEATDPTDAYWRSDPESFLFPRVPNAEGDITPDSPPAVAMFVSQAILANAVGTAFPGVAVNSAWYSGVDASVLQTWSKDQMRERMETLRESLSVLMPGALTFSGIDVMLIRFGRQSFLSSVPLLLLLTVLGVSVLYFLFMIVSYLVPNRESDVALFRSRGTSTWRLFKLYVAEGALLVIVAAAIAPFLALLMVWLAGMLPYFGHITDGRPLPVHPNWVPFAAASVAGLLCLVIFVVPGVLGARTGLIIHRLRASRPPSTPIVQRFYIDIGFLLIGGVLFWELQARGELVSGSLFGEQDVNEALLIAPVLFLMAVGLLFFRVFPMFVRYVSGESRRLVDLTAAIVLPLLAASIAFDEFRAGDQTGWLPEAALIAGVGAAYWLSSKTKGWRGRVLWIMLQVALVGWLTYQAPPDPDSPAGVFIGSIAVLCILPAQVLFYLLVELARRAPVWVSMSMWHMARNPLQYSWLVLLLVLAGGIGILSTTVGATLDRSYEERVRYTVGSDIRIVGLDSYFGRRDRRFVETFETIPGVESISVALRGQGRVGAGQIGPGFSFLAVDTGTFDGWHREDFSERTLGQLLSPLKVDEPERSIELPEDAMQIQIWVNPESYYPLIFLWIVLEDANGRTDTVTLHELPEPGWSLVSADVPGNLVHPIKVVSIQLNEPGYGATATAGAVTFDDLQAVGRAGNLTGLEGFEGPLDWAPLATSALGVDEIVRVSDDVRSGSGAARFKFGKETNVGVRGIYRAAGHGFIPAVASRTFAAAAGAGVNTGLLVNLPGGIVPVVITDIVEYFPTMDPVRGGFLIFDVATLFRYVDALNPLGNTAINEVFIRTAPGADMVVFQSVSELVRSMASAIGTEEQLAAQAIDPLISAGWRTIVLVALAVVLFIAGLGYVVYLLAFAERSVGEMGSLRSLGFSRLQTIGLIGLEHMLIALIGLGVGTWAGFQMSRMMVSAVAVTDGGGRVLPPFILTTNWTLMGPLYAVLAAVFVIALLTFGGRVLSIDLRRLSRLEN